MIPYLDADGRFEHRPYEWMERRHFRSYPNRIMLKVATIPHVQICSYLLLSAPPPAFAGRTVA